MIYVIIAALVVVFIAITVAGVLYRRVDGLDAAVASAREWLAKQEAERDAAEATAAKKAKEPATWLASKRRRQLMVHLNDDSTIRGVVLEASDEGVLLGAPEYLGDRTEALGGEVWIPAANVAFVQIPPRTK